jgi:hypothetical protein
VEPVPNDERPNRPWSQRFEMPNFSRLLQVRSGTGHPRPSNTGPSQRNSEIARCAEEAADDSPLADYSPVEPASIGLAVSTLDAGNREPNGSSSCNGEEEVRTSEGLVGFPPAETDVTPATGRSESKTTPYSAPCISDQPVSKRKNRCWRAWVCTTNGLRDMPVAAESRISKQRFVLQQAGETRTCSLPQSAFQPAMEAFK